MAQKLNRRTFVSGVTAVTMAGALAGCSSGGGGGGETTTEESGDTGGGGGDTTTETDSGSGSGGVPSEVTDYLSDVGNFDGSVSDETGKDSVTVMVGADGNNGNFAFEPAAIRVSQGTTVAFEWTGNGGAHNVVAEGGAFDSGDTVSEAGVNFEHTFDSTGAYRYYCDPHKGLGMKGAVIVEQ